MTTCSSPTRPHLPILRWGSVYESLDVVDLDDHRDGSPLVEVGLANAGLIRRDLWKAADAAAKLRAIPAADLIRMCAAAGEAFMTADLPLGSGKTQSPEDYVRTLSATSGLPHTLCRRNMAKVNTVFTEMDAVLRGLTRGLDLSVLDAPVATHDGMPLSFARTASALGVVLPSNSPGVNSIWMPAIALKVPVVLKPGREEPFTPWRIVQAFIAAGIPREAFGFYPTDHEGAATILEHCDRAIVFGDARTTSRYAGNPSIQIHGPGWSKIVIGPDEIDRWQDHLDVLVSSIVDNGGRSCINVSSIIVPSHGDEIAEALARAVGPIGPTSADDEDARLSAHANADIAARIDAMIESQATDGAADLAAVHRGGPRLATHDGATYLRPTVIRCDDIDHPLAKTEFMFPFTSVVEVEPDRMIDILGHSLVVTAITRDDTLLDALARSPHVDRLNIGPVPTTRVDWDQPHEGNLFEFLYTRRAIHTRSGWGDVA